MTSLPNAGEDQAIRRAGPWPRSGTFVDYMIATTRAVREACRTGDICYRFNQRYRFWENRDAWERAAPQLDRLSARRRKAIEIAEDRRWLLRRMLDPQRGAA
jgi:hypothetical protein